MDLAQLFIDEWLTFSQNRIVYGKSSAKERANTSATTLIKPPEV